MEPAEKKRKLDRDVDNFDSLDFLDSFNSEGDLPLEGPNNLGYGSTGFITEFKFVSGESDDKKHVFMEPETKEEKIGSNEEKPIVEQKEISEQKVDQEKWARLPDNQNLSRYEISDHGRVRDRETKNIISKSKKAGYFKVKLQLNNGNYGNFRVGRLVGLAFIPNPENKPEIDHVDRNRSNDFLYNLRWATKVEQRKNQKKREKYDKRTKSVVQLKDGKIVKIFPSSKEAAISVKVTSRTIRKYCKKGNIVNGYIYKYWHPKYADKPDDWKQVSSEYVPTKIWACRDGSVFINGAITKGNLDDNGYLQTSYGEKGEKYKFYVHVLVCLAFHGPPPDDIKTTVQHDNGIKTDNRVENLYWESHSGQIKHAIRTGLLKIKKKPVIQLSLAGEVIKEFPSVSEAHRAMGLRGSDINSVCLGKRKTAAGFKWKYKT